MLLLLKYIRYIRYDRSSLHKILILAFSIITPIVVLHGNCFLLQIDWINQQLRKRLEFVDTAYFVIQEWHENDMKVFSIQIKTLSNVLVLHSFSRHHLGANLLCLLWQRRLVAFVPFTQLFGILFRKEHLIDHNVVRVNAEFRQFLNQTFCFVNGKKFGNANANLLLKWRIRGGEW